MDRFTDTASLFDAPWHRPEGNMVAQRRGWKATVRMAGLGFAVAALLCLLYGCAAGEKRSTELPIGEPDASSRAEQRFDEKAAAVMAPVCIGTTGRIEAEDYDREPSAPGYFDLTRGNAGHVYRDDDVDVFGSAADGFHVGDIDATEWLAYTRCFELDGVYRVMFRVSSVSEVGAFRVEIDGKDETGDLVVPRTRHGGTWIPVWFNVKIDAGERTLRLIALRGGFQIDGIAVVRETTRINVRDHGAVGDGVADDSSAVLAAQRQAYETGAQLFFPSGTYRIRSIDHPALVRTFPVRVGWIGEDRRSTTIVHESTGIHSRGLSGAPEPGPINPQRWATPTTSPRIRLAQQTSTMRTVRASVAREAEQFSAGDAVFLAVGKNPYDADDEGLFRYVGIYNVEGVDPATGEIALDRTIPVPLTVEAPFDGTAGDVPDYAMGERYAKGDIVYHEHSFYRALSTGVAGATNPFDDGRVTAIQLVDRGADYSTNPHVVLVGDVLPGRRRARVKARTSNGRVHSIEVLGGGAGYVAPPAISIQDATGRGARATARVSGVAWRRLTNKICCAPARSDGMTRASQDYRPLLQKTQGLRPFLSLQNLTVRATGSHPHIEAIGFRGVQNGLIDNVRVVGNAAVGIGASVSANVRINRVEVDLDPVALSRVGNRAGGGWAAEHAVISNSLLRGGKTNPNTGNYNPALFLEGNADYTLYKTRIEPHVETTPDYTLSHGVMLDYAGVSIVDCDIGPYDAALRWNVALALGGIEAGALSPYYVLNDFASNTFRVSAQQLRLFGHDNPRVWNESSRYVFRDLFQGIATDYPDTINFEPRAIVEITKDFVPRAHQRPAKLDLARLLKIDGQTIDSHRHAFVILEVSAQWTGADPNGIDIRVGAHKDGTVRGFRSRYLDSSRSLFLSDVAPAVSDLDGNGMAVLYVEPARETLRISYYTGELRPDPGRVTVKLRALMGPRP